MPPQSIRHRNPPKFLPLAHTLLQRQLNSTHRGKISLQSPSESFTSRDPLIAFLDCPTEKSIQFVEVVISGDFLKCGFEHLGVKVPTGPLGGSGDIGIAWGLGGPNGAAGAVVVGFGILVNWGELLGFALSCDQRHGTGKGFFGLMLETTYDRCFKPEDEATSDRLRRVKFQPETKLGSGRSLDLENETRLRRDVLSLEISI